MKKLFSCISLLVLLLVMGCADNDLKVNAPSKSMIRGLASVVTLGSTGGDVNLMDYFDDPSQLDSISPVPGYTMNLDKTKGVLHATPNGSAILPLFEIKLWNKGFAYSLLGKKSSKQSVAFTFDPKGKTCKTVAVKGQMNDWNTKKGVMVLEKGIWHLSINMVPGQYQYVFVVDGKEMPDPANPSKIDNNMGGFNSLITLKGDDPEKAPYLYTLDAKKDKAIVAVKNNTKQVFVYWQNYRLGREFVKNEEGKLTITIPDNADDMDRSFIRVWAYNQFGISNDVLIPVEKGKVLTDASDLKRTDKESQILYFMMIDRFKDGNKSNDRKVNDPAVLPKVNYFGGDIAGITQKITDGFFDDLGINTIWLSPITQNPLGAWGQFTNPSTKFSGYHGYWPVTTTTVDNRYGTPDELRKLLDEAHKHKMNVLLDYVAHHVHIENPLYKLHPDWFTSLYLPDGTMNTEKWDDYRLTTWFDTFMPTLDNSKPEVVNPMTDSAMYWIRNYAFDGFRHDATKHIPELFWRTLTRKIKMELPDRSIYQIGETYGSPELINSYVSSGMLDGQFDFNVYDAAIGAIGKQDGDLRNLSSTLSQSLNWYGNHNLMGYITGNQDRPRFISLAGGSLKWDEDQKRAGWQREITIGDPTSFDKLKILQGFIFTIPGVPTIYYGDEIGMPGANDPDNRRMMKFEGLNKNEISVRDYVKKLVALRRNDLPLVYGDFKMLQSEKNIMAYMRTYFGKIALVAMNSSDKEQKVTLTLPEYYNQASLKANFGSSFASDNGKVTVTLKPRAFEILSN